MTGENASQSPAATPRRRASFPQQPVTPSRRSGRYSTCFGRRNRTRRRGMVALGQTWEASYWLPSPPAILGEWNPSGLRFLVRQRPATEALSFPGVLLGLACAGIRVQSRAPKHGGQLCTRGPMAPRCLLGACFSSSHWTGLIQFTVVARAWTVLLPSAAEQYAPFIVMHHLMVSISKRKLSYHGIRAPAVP